MAGWLHGVCVGGCLFVFPLCGFSLSLFCNYFGETAIAAACSLCHWHVLPSCPEVGSARRAQAQEPRWRHIEHRLFECPCISGLDSCVAITHLWDDLFWGCSGSDHAEAVSLTAFPSSHVPVFATMACIVPFLLDPANAVGRTSPWHMKLQCLDLGSCRSIPAWFVVCGVHPPAPVRVYVGALSPACLVLRRSVVTPPAVLILLRRAACA